MSKSPANETRQIASLMFHSLVLHSSISNIDIAEGGHSIMEQQSQSLWENRARLTPKFP